jgi:hypothetical protein
LLFFSLKSLDNLWDLDEISFMAKRLLKLMIFLFKFNYKIYVWSSTNLDVISTKFSLNLDTRDFFEVSKKLLLYVIKNNKLLIVQYYTVGWYIEHWLKHVLHQIDESNSFLAHHIIMIQHWCHFNIKCPWHFKKILNFYTCV